MDGVLVVDKPAGMTSHDVVDEVRRRLGTRKVGHAGTLDPDATGLLIVGVGRATRLLSYAQDAPKRYRALARFGVTTATQDASGEILERRAVDVTRAEVERAAEKFVGEIEQIPPMVSAVKIAGERLYKKARRGEEIERKPRLVSVYELRLVTYDDESLAELDVLCSAGTYVRTLIHDLGQALGCGAHMASLRRTAAAGFTERDALALDEVSRDRLRPLTDAVRVLPRLDVDEHEVLHVRHGRPLERRSDLPEGNAVALVHDGALCAVYKATRERLVPDRVIPS